MPWLPLLAPTRRPTSTLVTPRAALRLPAQLACLRPFRHLLALLDEQTAKDEGFLDAGRLVARLGHIFGWPGRLLEQPDMVYAPPSASCLSVCLWFGWGAMG